MSSLNLSAAVAALEALRVDVIESLRGGQAAALIQRKTELDDAIGCLQLCQRHQIGPRARVLVLPEPLTRTPSSEFRLMEDHESEDRQHWREVLVDGVPHRPRAGDLFILR